MQGSEMCKNILITLYSLFDAFLRVNGPERLLGWKAQQSYQTAKKPSADDTKFIDAWKAVPEESDPQEQTTGFVNQPETIKPSFFINVDQAALLNFVDNEVKHQIADCLIT